MMTCDNNLKLLVSAHGIELLLTATEELEDEAVALLASVGLISSDESITMVTGPSFTIET